MRTRKSIPARCRMIAVLLALCCLPLCRLLAAETVFWTVFTKPGENLTLGKFKELTAEINQDNQPRFDNKLAGEVEIFVYIAKDSLNPKGEVIELINITPDGHVIKKNQMEAQKFSGILSASQVDALPIAFQITFKGPRIYKQLPFNRFSLPGYPGLNLAYFWRQFTGDNRFDRILTAFRNPLIYPDYYIVAAHRGYWNRVPEGTTKAYDLSIQAGADMIELDTRMTTDGVLVTSHDEALNRTTTGNGMLTYMTWAQIKDLNLRDRFGIQTNDHLLSTEDALKYLRGKALINLDIKYRRGLGAEAAAREFEIILRKSLLLAVETKTLPQLVLKGKLSVKEFKDSVLTPVNKTLRIKQQDTIALGDIIYTPVVFGWDTKNMPAVVTQWLKEPIYGIELTYKTSYDPLLPYVGLAINKGVRVGSYSFWPEETNGVIGEDNINNDKKFYTHNYRAYDFKGETKRLVKTSFTDYGSGDDGGGGGKVATKPDGTDDGRGDWDWLTGLGTDFIITDRPELMIEYLDIMGKRDLRPAVIQEVPLPENIQLTDYTNRDKEGKPLAQVKKIDVPIKTLRGLVRKIDDYRKVEFFTPDTRGDSVDRNLIHEEFLHYANWANKEYVAEKNATASPCTCDQIFADAAEKKIRRFPMRDLPKWSIRYPGYDIYMNANFFDVKEPFPLDRPTERNSIPNAPHIMPCTDVFGFWQSNSGDGPEVLSTPWENDPDHSTMDAMIVDNSGNLRLYSHKEMTTFKDTHMQGSGSVFGIGGIIIAKNGVPVAFDDLPEGSSRNTPKKKSLIGFDGFTIYFAEIQAPQLGTYTAAELMTKYFHCREVFMVDGGGSSTMLTTRGLYPPINADAGDNITSGSAGEDKNKANQKVYRPIPNFLAIRVKK